MIIIQFLLAFLTKAMDFYTKSIVSLQYDHRYVTEDGLCHTLTILSNINTSYFFYGLAFPFTRSFFGASIYNNT